MSVSTLQDSYKNSNQNDANISAEWQLIHLAESMNQRAQSMEPFQEEELDHILSSLSTARTMTQSSSSSSTTTLDHDEPYSSRWNSIRSLFATVGHLSHKNWTQTADFASKLHPLLLVSSTKDDKEEVDLHPEFRDIFERVLTDGNWDAAASQAAASSTSHHTPFIVLVTGVNGIRKTTSVYQPWFEQVLQEALVHPATIITHSSIEPTMNPPLSLPTGQNSFFRQLDHMVATLVHTYFQLLYRLTSKTLDLTSSSSTLQQGMEQTSSNPPKKVISLYSQFKAALFTRFRTISEMVGIIFIREAMNRNMNIMIETSGT